MTIIKEIIGDTNNNFSKLTQHGVVDSALTHLVEKYSGIIEEGAVFKLFKFKVNNYECRCFLFHYSEATLLNGEVRVILEDLRISINGRGCYMPLFNIASSFGSFCEDIEQIANRFFNYLEVKSEIHPKVESDIDELFCLDFELKWLNG